MSAKTLQDRLNDEGDCADVEDFGEVVLDTDWVNEGKFDLRTMVVRVKDEEHGITPGYYEVSMDRSGSYFTDYYYGEITVTEVERYEVVETVVKYKAK